MIQFTTNNTTLQNHSKNYLGKRFQAAVDCCGNKRYVRGVIRHGLFMFKDRSADKCASW